MGSISCFPLVAQGEKDEGVLGLCKQPVNMYAQAITPEVLPILLNGT